MCCCMNEVEKRGGWEKKTKKEWRRMRERKRM